MIGWFPAPYPDETFDSLCYRYAARLRYPHKTGLGGDLFGQRISRVTVDVPSRLEYFIAHLPPGSALTASYLLENHTFLPYYRPFLPPAIYAQMVAQIMGTALDTNVLSALSKFRRHVPVYLRYCPACALADRQRCGETYWHRQHQLPGVQVCPRHAVWLESSPIYAKYRSFVQGPVTAEEVLGSLALKPRPLDTSKTARRRLQLSQNSDWLLTQTLPPEPEALFRKYRWALRARGYLTAQDGIRRDRFLHDFLDAGFGEWSDALGGEGPGRIPAYWRWGPPLTEHGYHQGRLPPLFHLLLIQFFSGQAASFFTLPEAWHPFGVGPWPCLNRTCPQYRQPVIPTCQVSRVSHRLRVEVHCDCGFTYWRWGSEQTADACFAYDGVVAYGKVWEDALRALWADPSIPLRTMREMLGLGSLDTLKHHALRLGLPFQEHRDVACPKSLHADNERDRRRRQWIATRRQQLLDLLRANPNLTRRQLEAAAPTILRYLAQVDTEWLDQVAPSPGRLYQQVNWMERDEQLAERIPALADQIKTEAGEPIRVTRAELGRRLQAQNLILNCKHKLPQTMAALEQVCESREDFAIRRVRWASDRFIQEKERPRWWTLVIRAGVEKSLFPRVTAVVDEVLATIHEAIEQRGGGTQPG